jgi:hypothetical protein
MAVDSWIRVPPDGTGKRIRAVEETNLSGDVVYSKVIKVSGETVVAKVSGETVKISGETVVQASGSFVIAKSSGEIYIAKISGEVVRTWEFGYEKAVVSGAVVMNIVSGQVILHTVALNRYTSGQFLRVFDSCSGAAGITVVEAYAGTTLLIPSTLILDCVMTSGIVVATSGATWHATVTYRKPF